MESQSTSPLLRLPPELRNMIYAFTFKNYILPINKGSWSKQLGCELLCTCKQIRSEALGIYYHSATFVSGVFDDACDWMEEKIPATHAAMVKRVKISIGLNEKEIKDDELKSEYVEVFQEICSARGAKLEMLKVTFDCFDGEGDLVAYSEVTIRGDGAREYVRWTG